jgi:hypothetical protein
MENNKTREYGNCTWQEVADRIGQLEGKTITHQAMSQHGDRILCKLRDALMGDPLIKDWLHENGLGDLYE